VWPIGRRICQGKRKRKQWCGYTAHRGVVLGSTTAKRAGRRTGADVKRFVTAERVREGNSSEGDDVASITGRSRDISGTYTRGEHNSNGADQLCQKFLKRGGTSSV